MSQPSIDSGHAIIYGLFEEDDLVYVGVTTRPLAVRMREHRSRARNGDTLPVYEWLRLHPDSEARVLALVDRSARFEAEKDWILSRKPRLNMIVKWEWTEEMRARRVETRRATGGYVISPAGRERISQANTGREGHWVGKRMSDSHVLGFSGERNGHASLTDAQAIEVRQAYLAGESAASMARTMGMPYATIYRAATGRTYGRVTGAE